MYRLQTMYKYVYNVNTEVKWSTNYVYFILQRALEMGYIDLPFSLMVCFD